ncbi:hypothetical protein [Caulobacter sp. S45]|jgi:hypothetical protein|uniref:hypothetical protein n=1 Tax=Caulobacter sp. S45 TaxID=1641861 RepID=UPI00131B9A08|nr:hypothetical protein [Caulobacter sp. S45]
MVYNIFAQNLLGAIALERENAPSALKKARELRQDGMWNVRIADEEGHWLSEDVLAFNEEPQGLQH